MVLDGPSDADLLRGFVDGGDRAALSVLFERHRALAYRVALGVLRHADDAEDAAQTAFANLTAYAPRAQVDVSLAGLVARMALRAAQHLASSGGRRRLRETAWAETQELYGPDPFDAVAQQEAARRVRDEVCRLEERYRLPVVLHYFEGLTTRETAQALGITQTAVTTRLSRAVGKLRRRLAREGGVLPVAALLSLLRPQHAEAAPPSLAARLQDLAASAAAPAPAAGAGALLAASIGALRARLLVGAAVVAISLGGIGALRKLPPPAGAGAAIPPLTHTRPDTPRPAGMKPAAPGRRSDAERPTGRGKAPSPVRQDGRPQAPEHRVSYPVPAGRPPGPLPEARSSAPDLPRSRSANGADASPGSPRAGEEKLLLAAGAPAPAPTTAAPTPEDALGPGVGPRGLVGPDVPLTEAEAKALARRVVVEGRTAAAVQAACDRAVGEGIPVVFLPAGEYVFEAEVKVPGGLTLLGEGSRTILRTKEMFTRLFSVDGDRVRFTRMRLQGADTSTNKENSTFGVLVVGKTDVRVDHCEILGFKAPTRFYDDASGQVDHCFIHDNLNSGSGYGVETYSGAYVLVADNEFTQNRGALRCNGAVEDTGNRYVHTPGFRKTHCEFRHNHVHDDDRSEWQDARVNVRPGMDGTTVVEGNLFENVRLAVAIEDGSGIVRANLFRAPAYRTGHFTAAITVSASTINGTPVENAMPHDVELVENTFLDVGPNAKCQIRTAYGPLGKAQNVSVDGKVIPETLTEGTVPPPIPYLEEVGDDRLLTWRDERPPAGGVGSVAGTVTDEAGRPVAGASVVAGDRPPVTTGPDGRFRFPEVAEAAGFLAVSKAGFEPALPGLRVLPGQEATRDVRLVADRTPPAILNLRIGDLTDVSATVTWRTSEPAVAEWEHVWDAVAGGTAIQGRKEQRPSTSHLAKLEGLQPRTTYLLRIKASDPAGNAAPEKEVLLTTAPARDAALPADWGYFAVGGVVSVGGKGCWGRTAEEAHSGRFSAFLRAADPAGSLLHLGLVVANSNGFNGAAAYPVQPGATYRYSFWAKGDLRPCELRLIAWKSEAGNDTSWDMTYGRNGGTQHPLVRFSAEKEWTRYQGEFRMPDDARRFALLICAFKEDAGPADMGVLYVDDVEVSTAGASVVRNGGAEN